MRTTLEVDDQVMAVARARARAHGVSIRRAGSDLALEGIACRDRVPGPASRSAAGSPVLTGVPGHVITHEMVADPLNED